MYIYATKLNVPQLLDTALYQPDSTICVARISPVFTACTKCSVCGQAHTSVTAFRAGRADSDTLSQYRRSRPVPGPGLQPEPSHVV